MTFMESCVMDEIKHYPVMYREARELLRIEEARVIVDCTLGLGGHACCFLEAAKNLSLYVGIDKDEESLSMAGERLKSFSQKLRLVKSDFSHLDEALKNSGVNEADAIFFDLGISAYQLTKNERGFSFLQEGPLDMRMDRDSFVSAYDLVNNLSEEELTSVFFKFGEEHYSRRIARSIVEARSREPISTTIQLARLVGAVVPVRSFKYRIHPATRIFQALRIAVNRELESLDAGVQKGISLLAKGGRIGVISFHSLEDRIVKQTFKESASRGIIKVITKKPVEPQDKEIEENTPSRSAKLRVGEKI